MSEAVKELVKELEAEQLEAWREGAADQLALIPTDRPELDPAEVREARGRRGRPKGARDRKTQELVTYLKSRYRHPLEALAEAWSRPVAVLAAELGCDKVKAYELQQEAAKASLPYWASKQPVAVSLEGKGVVQLIIGEVALQEGGEGENAVIIDGTIAGEESEEDQ